MTVRIIHLAYILVILSEVIAFAEVPKSLGNDYTKQKVEIKINSSSLITHREKMNLERKTGMQIFRKRMRSGKDYLPNGFIINGRY